MTERPEAHYRSAVLRQTAVLGLAVAGLFTVTETPVESVTLGNFKKHVVEPVLHHYGRTGYWEVEDDSLADPVYVQAGTIAVEQSLGRFTHFVTAEARLNGKVFGQTFETSKSVREGLVVNRLMLPGIAVANVRSTKNVLYITQLENGKDVGIETTNAFFELADPEAAQEINGSLQCTLEPQDRDFSGCVSRDTIRAGFFADVPVIGEDQEGRIYDSAEILFDEYAQIEKCHFDTILIPKINDIYENLYADQNIAYRIDGPQRYQQTMEILIRGLWRDRIKEGRVPQAVFFRLQGNYEPKDAIHIRLQNRADTLDFPFEPPKDFDVAYCAKGPNDTMPFW